MKAKLKNCSDETKEKFKDSSCILAISVGQEYHEGEKLSSAVQLINRSSFKKCYIFVDDTLQRHTLSLYHRKTDEQLFEDSFLDGTRWIERNRPIYEQLKVPFEIVRWNHWLYHPEFPSKLAFVNHKFKEDAAYRNEFYRSVEGFVSRYKDRKDNIYSDEKHVIDTCITYVKEESAAMFLWIEKKPNFILYPGQFNEAMTATREKYILPSYPELLNNISFRFRSTSQNKITANQHKKTVHTNLYRDIVAESAIP